METKSRKIVVSLIIGFFFSILAYIYFRFLEDFIFEDNTSHRTIIEKFLNMKSNDYFSYLTFSFFLNLGAAINLYLITKNKIYISIKRFFLSSVGFYILMYLTYYHLSKVLVYLGFLTPIVSYSLYVLMMAVIYKIQNISSAVLIGAFTLLIAVFVMNSSENFEYLDFLFFLCITTLFPIAVRTNKIKTD
ncbi:hypothetical protein KORDIASMS9_01820 [Kordia sp. SMS9]|nr:hypothetical protein KORDIASMS9_01820 [Kordia sp. SMS9]